MVVGVAALVPEFKDTGSHADKRITRIHPTIKLLSTLAVYHN